LGSATTPESVAVVVAICALMHGALLTNKASSSEMLPQNHRDSRLLLLFVFKVKPPSGCTPRSDENFSSIFFMPDEVLGRQ